MKGKNTQLNKAEPNKIDYYTLLQKSRFNEECTDIIAEICTAIDDLKEVAQYLESDSETISIRATTLSLLKDDLIMELSAQKSLFKDEI